LDHRRDFGRHSLKPLIFFHLREFRWIYGVPLDSSVGIPLDSTCQRAD
jgi:hypothetical protein